LPTLLPAITGIEQAYIKPRESILAKSTNASWLQAPC
jgi:hypothetical protein